MVSTNPHLRSQEMMCCAVFERHANTIVNDFYHFSMIKSPLNLMEIDMKEPENGYI